jgi:hypothetical protein
MREAAIPADWDRALRAAALLLNALLFGVGLYFEIHPRDSHDRWSAAGVAGIAILNSAALTAAPAGAVARHLVARLRRIATMANGLLLLIGGLLMVFESFLDGRHALVLGLALVAPPLLTMAALRRVPRVR